MVLAEKIALVTGAGRGMGRAIALQYAQAGAAVAAADIDGQTAQETSAAIEAAGGRSLPIQADVGELTSLERMIQQTVETFGRLDVIVNNAGVTRYLDIMEVTEADWDRIHRVNAKGVFFCLLHAEEHAFGVDTMDAVPVRLSDLHDVQITRHASVVHDHVQASERLHGLLYHALKARELPDISLDREAPAASGFDGGTCLLGRLPIDICCGYGGSSLGVL